MFQTMPGGKTNKIKGIDLSFKDFGFFVLSFAIIVLAIIGGVTVGKNISASFERRAEIKEVEEAKVVEENNEGFILRLDELDDDNVFLSADIDENNTAIMDIMDYLEIEYVQVENESCWLYIERDGTEVETCFQFLEVELKKREE